MRGATIRDPSRLLSLLGLRLLGFLVIFAVAGSQRHVFAESPGDIERITGPPIANFCVTQFAFLLAKSKLYAKK
jgi:hypothetical protein